MPWLTLKLKMRVNVRDNEIQTCIYALVITESKTKSNAFRSCFWRTSFSDKAGKLQIPYILPLTAASVVALNEHRICLFLYNFATKCVNMAVIYCTFCMP